MIDPLSALLNHPDQILHFPVCIRSPFLDRVAQRLERLEQSIRRIAGLVSESGGEQSERGQPLVLSQRMCHIPKSQLGLDPGEKLPRREWLGNVVVGSMSQSVRGI